MNIPRISITVKNALVYLVLLVLSSATLGYAIYRLSSNKVRENTLITLIHNNESAVLQFNAFLEDVRRDVWYLSKNPLLKDFIEKPQQNILKNKLATEFLAMLTAKDHYAQLRVISVEGKGKEQLRVDKTNGKLFVVHDSLLQIKGDRDYFRETVQLPQDSIYFSEINLNQEYGKVFIPVVPTLRVAAPLFVNESVWGIVIINVDLRFLFRKLEQLAGSRNELSLLNPNGYYLIHPDSAQEFLFEFEGLPNVELDLEKQSWLSTNLPSLTSKAFLDKHHAKSIIEYNYPRKSYLLYFMLSGKEADLLNVFNKWKWNILYLTLIFIFASIAIAIYWTRRQAREFKEITQSIIDFGTQPNVVSINIERNDEIGDLVKSFQEMSGRVHHYVNELMLAKNEADQANKAKQAFIENMSHEMRNPLQSIIGMTHMLEQNQPRADQKAFIQNLKFSAEHLLTLVNDVLDYRKLLNNQIVLAPKEIHLEEYINQIVKGHLFEAGQRKIKIKHDLDKQMQSLKIQADPVRLAQIINNLLTNAIRYSPENSTINLRIWMDEHKHCCFEVLDQGPGISQENIENILRLRPVTGKALQSQNVGLGLPIVNRLLTLMQSDLIIQPRPGGGMCFGFKLALNYSSQPSMNSISDDAAFYLRPMIQTCACLDDDPQNAFYYKHLFEKVGIHCDWYEAPQALLNCSVRYPLIITDIHFANEQLLHYLDDLRMKLDTPNILVVVSARDDISPYSDLLHADKEMFLQKPVTPEQLLNAVEHLLFLANFKTPAFNNLYALYDDEPSKSLQALELLSKEYIDLTPKLREALSAHDLTEFDRINHRLANSMRLLGMELLEQKMILTRELVSKNTTDAAYATGMIVFGFHYLLKLFSTELDRLKNLNGT